MSEAANVVSRTMFRLGIVVMCIGGVLFGFGMLWACYHFMLGQFVEPPRILFAGLLMALGAMLGLCGPAIGLCVLRREDWP